MSKMQLCKFEFEPLRAQYPAGKFSASFPESAASVPDATVRFFGSQMNRIARRTLIGMLVIAILAVLSMKSVDRYKQSHHGNHVTTAE